MLLLSARIAASSQQLISSACEPNPFIRTIVSIKERVTGGGASFCIKKERARISSFLTLFSHRANDTLDTFDIQIIAASELTSTLSHLIFLIDLLVSSSKHLFTSSVAAPRQTFRWPLGDIKDCTMNIFLDLFYDFLW